VPAYAAAGKNIKLPLLPCPDCGTQLERSGGYFRFARELRQHRIWIRRGRCRPCGKTHALLPSFLLQRRLDLVEVIGTALSDASRGTGLRTVAERVGRPHTTVRDWWRRFRQQAKTMVMALSCRAIELGIVLPRVSPAADWAALETLAAVWQYARHRWGQSIAGLWQFWSGISGGLALGRHTSPPLAAVEQRLDGPSAVKRRSPCLETTRKRPRCFAIA